MDGLSESLLKEIGHFDPDTIINRIMRGIKVIYEEMKAEGILVNVKNTLSSFINIILIVKTIGRSSCYGICFEQPRIRIKNIERIYRLSRFNLSRLDIKHVYKYIKRNIPDLGYQPTSKRVKFHNLNSEIELLFLRYYAQENNYILCGDIERTRWLLGAYDRYLAGSVDILPLTGIYKSQLRIVARKLRIAHLAKDADEPAGWLYYKKKRGLDIPDEKIDAILYGFDLNWTIDKIAKDLDTDQDIVRRIREIVDSANIFRHLPLTL